MAAVGSELVVVPSEKNVCLFHCNLGFRASRLGIYSHAASLDPERLHILNETSHSEVYAKNKLINSKVCLDESNP